MSQHTGMKGLLGTDESFFKPLNAQGILQFTEVQHSQHGRTDSQTGTTYIVLT